MLRARERGPARDGASTDVRPIVLDSVSKRFRQGRSPVTAVDGVSLCVEPGEFLAVMGASGSGKSTLLHLAAGLTRPDDGEVWVEGEAIGQLSDRALTRFRRRRIGLVFQTFNLIPTLSAEENIALPLELDGVDPRGVRERVGRVVERLDLGPRRDHRPDAMSGGEQQRVAIGRALVSEPAVVLADEPTGNLDGAASRSLCGLLQELAETEGTTIVLVTHEPAVAVHAHATAVIRDGRLVTRFPTWEAPDPQTLAGRYHAAMAPEGTEAEANRGG